MEDFGTKAAYDIITDVGKEVGKAVAMPAAIEVGKALGTVLGVINSVLTPFEIFNLRRRFRVEETKKLLEHKLVSVPLEDIVTPEAYVAMPAIEAISYSMDNQTLRNLYANLLAKAMVKNRMGSVHPAFVEIIKQLSPIDAEILEIISKTKFDRPIIKFLTPGGQYRLATYFTWIKKYTPFEQGVSITNLERLGLLRLDFQDRYRTDSERGIFKKIEADLDFIEHRIELEKPFASFHPGKLKTSYGFIFLTDLGYSFEAVCIDDTI